MAGFGGFQESVVERTVDDQESGADDHKQLRYPAIQSRESDRLSHQDLLLPHSKETNEISELQLPAPSIRNSPSPLLVHGALILAQIIFGSGSVVGKLGIDKFNPVLFALIRDGAAAPILVTMALVMDGNMPKKIHFPRFLVTGLFIFLSQLLFLIGLKLSNAVLGSAWQPSQSIMVTAIAIALRMEKANILKIMGIFVAFGGAMFMVLFDAHYDSGKSEIAGNILFFFNCMSTALYVIYAKPLYKHYSPISVTAYSYLSASVLMGIATVSMNHIDGVYDFVCDDCPPGSKWKVPANAWYALVYWVLFSSVATYALLTWGNKYAGATSSS
mmetsp:Transcript_41490/g.66710  ORF Transcript_41490/g.66710 Transcript_41490/m.66710 type:complete len:330 (-) Transcript_41490:621-1610(-)|eukprot:jgi/Bigna1/137525/aug1.39_g12233